MIAGMSNTELREKYMAAKFGIIEICENCLREIYQPNFGVYDELGYKFRHTKTNAVACYNDIANGRAYPLDTVGLEKLYDYIKEGD